MSGIQALGIDLNSLLLYLVNFGLLFFVVAKFIVNPITKILEQRTKSIENSINEAEHLKSQMAQEKKELLEAQNKMKAQMNEELRKFEIAMKKKMDEAEKETAQIRQKMVDDAEKSINQRKEAIMKEIKDEVLGAITEVVRTTLKGRVSKEVVEESVIENWKSYSKRI